MEPGDSISCS